MSDKIKDTLAVFERLVGDACDEAADAETVPGPSVPTSYPARKTLMDAIEALLWKEEEDNLDRWFESATRDE